MIKEPTKKIKMVDIVRPVKKTEVIQEIKWEIKEEIREKPKSPKVQAPKAPVVKKIVEKRKRRVSWKFILFLIVLALLVYLMFWVLPKAEINITTKKVPLNLVEQISAIKDTGNVDILNKQIPAEIFSQVKNNTFSFPATGKKNVENKTQGEVAIYNTYSSDSQTLIANTRLLTPDGKVFHLKKTIIVPGAKIIEGKIVSSNIKAEVIADKAGQEYNIGPVDHFTIPGFQGSDKYQGFYAKSESSMTGGFIGEVPVPTDDDLKKAKENAEKSLQDYFNAFFYTQVPQDFKKIDGASQFNILKEEINKEVDSQGNFSIFIEAESSLIIFHQDDILSIFTALAKEKLGGDFKLNSYEISYSNTVSDFKKGTLNSSVNFQGLFRPPINTNELKQEIINKNELELKTLLFSQTNVDKARVYLWPFWVRKTPNDVNKIKLIIE